MQINDRIGHRLKLHNLHVLMAVVQAGSMNKAAALLNTTQPNVSKSIAELERTVGVRLLDRNAGGVEPTAYGRALLNGGIAVFGELRQALKSIEFLADPTAGEVRIGCNPFLAPSFVSAVVDRLSRRCPRIEFHIVTGRVAHLHHGLRDRNVDFLITRRSGLLAEMGFEFLFGEPYVVVAGTQSPWSRRRRIAFSELIGESWTLPPPGSVITTVATEGFLASGLDYPRAAVVTDSATTRISLAATGRFLTILQASALRFPTRQPEIKALPVEPRMADTPIGVITLKNRTLSPVATLFIEHAREVAKPLAKK